MPSQINLRGVTAKAGASASALLFLAVAVLASALMLSACDTAQHVGKDVNHAVKHVVD